MLSPVNMSALQSPAVASRFHHSSVVSPGALFSPRAPPGGTSRADLVRVESELKQRLDAGLAKIEEGLRAQELARVSDRAALLERIDSHLLDALRAGAAAGGAGAGAGGGASAEHHAHADTAKLEVLSVRLQDVIKRMGA